MATMWEEIRFKVLHSGSRLNLLMGINIAVFLVLGILFVVEKLTTRDDFLHRTIFSNLEVPSHLPTLLRHFWTPFTYMFLHEGIVNILFNMLWFFWMGQIFEEYLGGKKLTALYIFGGLSGAFLYILAYNVFPLFAETRTSALVVGAPACVMAIIVGTATLLPNYTIFVFFFEVRLKYLALIYVLFDLLPIGGPPAEREFAHLGGALMGFIYIKQLRNGKDWGRPFEKMFQPKSPLKIAAKNMGKVTYSKPHPDEVDRILDKISQTGYESLNKQEKEILFRASNDDKS